VNSTDLWTKCKGAGLYRYNPSGQYFARIRVGGKLHRKKLNTNDFPVARRKLDDFKRDLGRTDARLGNASFGSVLDAYADTIGGLAKSSQRDKRAIISKLRSTWFGIDTLPLWKVKPSQVEAWLSDHYGKFTASAYNSALTLIRDALDLAVRDRIVVESPAAHLKYRRREQPIRLTPSFEEFQAIVADIRAQPFNADAKDSADFVEFIGFAGLGQAEASALTAKHVKFQAGQIQLFRRKTRQAFVIPIYPQVRPLLEKLCAGLKSDDKVFPIVSARKAIAGACSRLGLPRYTHRSFRRMFITRAIELGVDVKVIAEWQGHSDGGKLILDTYSHVNPVHSNRMAQLMTTERPGNVVAMPQSA
jgi:integrase